MIRSKTPVRRHIQQIFETILASPPKRRSLRVSGLPYCSILDAILPTPEEEYMDFLGMFFTTIGTDVHSALQLFAALAPLGKYMYGNWICPKCKAELSMQFRPDKRCEPCNVPYIYKEIQFRIGSMAGHLDFLACYKGKWIALEFKTTGLIEGVQSNLPKHQHFIQIRTYCAMLLKNYNIKVYGYGIVYFSRLNAKPKFFGLYAPTTLQKTTNQIFYTMAGFKAAGLYRKTPTVDNLKDVIEKRPCKSEEDWDLYMGTAYKFSKEPCPLLDSCTKSSKAVLKKLRDITA